MIRKLAAAVTLAVALVGTGTGLAQAAAPTPVQPVAAGQTQAQVGEAAGTVIDTFAGAGVGAVAGGTFACMVTLPVCPATAIVGAVAGGVAGGVIGATLGAGAGGAIGAQIPS